MLKILAWLCVRVGVLEVSLVFVLLVGEVVCLFETAFEGLLEKAWFGLFWFVWLVTLWLKVVNGFCEIFDFGA